VLWSKDAMRMSFYFEWSCPEQRPRAASKPQEPHSSGPWTPGAPAEVLARFVESWPWSRGKWQAAEATFVVGKAVLTLHPPRRPLSHNAITSTPGAGPRTSTKIGLSTYQSPALRRATSSTSCVLTSAEEHTDATDPLAHRPPPRGRGTGCHGISWDLVFRALPGATGGGSGAPTTQWCGCNRQAPPGKAPRRRTDSPWHHLFWVETPCCCRLARESLWSMPVVRVSVLLGCFVWAG
jgi:hypothetical protein